MELIRKIFCTIWGGFVIFILKLFHWRNIHSGPIVYISPSSEISISKIGRLFLGNYSQIRNGAKLRIRNSGVLTIGSHFHSGNGSMLVCHKKISIGHDVQFGPEVLVYDHDHDFSHPLGLKAEKYKYGAVIIGNSVWIGARTIILRGTEIGDNCVIGAGSILKGKYPPNSIIYQYRNTEIRPYNKRNDNDIHSN